jgi:L-cysteine desulfidase
LALLNIKSRSRDGNALPTAFFVNGILMRLDEMTHQDNTQKYIRILEEELVSATGCTEPIAIALAAAHACRILGVEPAAMTVGCSRNMYKNTRSVTVPKSGGMVGIRAAAVLGAVGGDSSLAMDVLQKIGPEDIACAKHLLETGFCEVEILDSDIELHIVVEVTSKQDWASVEVKHRHTNITRIIHNGHVTVDSKAGVGFESYTDRSVLNVADIYTFAKTVELSAVLDMLEKQIHHNLAIAEEGLMGVYGVGIGKLLLSNACVDWALKARAYAAAASEARMSGCPMPVITNSGSGNQGITCSVPLVVMADEMEASQEDLIRALLFSNLLTIHIKTGIGRLSAFCGAIGAACGAGAGMTFLSGGTLAQVEQTISNILANTPGVICDGAKPSCAAKIATGLDAAVLGHRQVMQGQVYHTQSGILKPDVEALIRDVGRIGKIGMRKTDDVIIDLMMESDAGTVG